MRKTTKAEKIAAYDGLVTYKGDTNMLHYLMAFQPCAFDEERSHDEGDDGEAVVVRVQGWGLGRADGGYVLVSAWTLDRDGDRVGEHVVFAGSLLSMPDGGERYYATTGGQALRSAFLATRSASHAALTAGVRA